MGKFRNFEKYEVYEDGRIWSYKTNRFLKPATTKKGYQRVALSDNEGNIKMYLLHRVVWESVTGSPIPKGMQINHRNEIKTSNMISNLELVTPKYNCNFGTRNIRVGKGASKALKNNPKISKSVGAFKNNELIFTFPSTQEARRQGFNEGAVAACCRNCFNREGNNVYKGYEWRYL